MLTVNMAVSALGSGSLSGASLEVGWSTKLECKAPKGDQMERDFGEESLGQVPISGRTHACRWVFSGRWDLAAALSGLLAG
jgi:hypothetical protein